MSKINDPLTSLLDGETRRADAARALAALNAELTEKINQYRDAWNAATAAGWPKAALKSAGLIDPAGLPRPRRARATTSQED